MTTPTVPIGILRQFPKLRQERGQRLFEHVCVDLLDVDSFGDDATISGSVRDRQHRRSPLQVTIDVDLNDDYVSTDCTCMGARNCEHAFATLLAFLQQQDQRLVEAKTQQARAQLRPIGTPGQHKAPSATGPGKAPARTTPAPPTWQSRIANLTSLPEHDDPPTAAPATPVELHFCIDGEASRRRGQLVMVVLAPRHIDGVERLSTFNRDQRPHCNEHDRRAMVLLESLSSAPMVFNSQSVFTMPPHATDLALALAYATGRLGYCRSFTAQSGLEALHRDTGKPFRCVTRTADEATQLAVHAELRRGNEVLTPELLLPEGFAIARQRLVRVEIGRALPLLQSLLHDGPLQAPREEAGKLIAAVLEETAEDPLCTPPVEVQPAAAPTPVLIAQMARATPKYVPCELHFAYGERLFELDDELVQPPASADAPWTVRDPNTELALMYRVAREYAAVLDATTMPGCYTMPRKDALARLTAIVQQGLRVMIDGKPILPSSGVSVSVASGIDWFDVHGEVHFGDGASTPLATALLAAKKGSQLVELGDGRTGVLPQELLDKWAAVFELGEDHDGAIRLPRGQALLLDALLASRASEVAADAGFRAFRQRLAAFSGISARREPDGFGGTLRDYQRLGLGWLWFLRDLGLGGCLADDMGLGKTVQVLALLLEVHRAHDRAPSLLVAPRSLLDNWHNEAQRFASGLRVLDFSGPARWAAGDRPFDGYDLVLTTYGTLRSDVARYDELGVRFEYAILDEAQAIGNAQSITSKAARLLRADHRLALTGTPVQNHIGELWALFEFLSPGLLGRSTTFQRLVGNVRGRSINLPIDELRRGLAPFLLRRTKEQVLAELPEKQEQTLHCELGPAQRKTYDGLRAHYRSALLQSAGELDNQERFLALEALLRLRQAACHEGLIDAARADAGSAKLDALLPMLEEIAASGHKALVFSQFTQLLGIVRKALVAKGVDHEYLDGKTRKRQSKVDRFQQEPGCAAFLISLKAGGFGLNLTAADYVFLLDPWWNPAAEAQAIDRAHRIGQTQKVVAYRMVARDTVEEKVLRLQQEKRELADALLGDNASLLAGLDRQQLAALLG